MSDREKTIRSEQAARKQEKKDRNNTIIGICLIVIGIMSTIYLTDLNTVFTALLSGIVAGVYNFFAAFTSEPDLLTVAEVASVTQFALGIILYGALGLAYYTNKQNV